MKKQYKSIISHNYLIIISVSFIMILSSSSTIANQENWILTNKFDINFESFQCFPSNHPFVLSDEETLGYSGLGWGTSIGYNNSEREPPFTFEAAIRLTPEELAPYDGWEIIAVQFIHQSYGTQFDNYTNEGFVKVYDAGTSVNPGELISKEPFNATGYIYSKTNLSNPVIIDSQSDLWTSIEITHEQGQHPICVDYGPAVIGKGDWVQSYDEPWVELRDEGLDRNLHIQAIVSYPEKFNAYAYGPYIGELGEPINFLARASGGKAPYSFHWSFGDGEYSNEQNPSHIFNEAKTYHISLTVGDSESNEMTVETIATVTLPPDPPVEETELKINDIFGNFGKICTDIKNIGDVTANGLKIDISISGGFLNRINITKSCEGCNQCNTSLEPEEIMTECTNRFLRGFGKIKITVSAEADNADKVIRTVEGYKFLIFTIIDF